VTETNGSSIQSVTGLPQRWNLTLLLWKTALMVEKSMEE